MLVNLPRVRSHELPVEVVSRLLVDDLPLLAEFTAEIFRSRRFNDGLSKISNGLVVIAHAVVPVLAPRVLNSQPISDAHRNTLTASLHPMKVRRVTEA